MNKTIFLLLIICGLTLTQKNFLFSDQPNGEPWAENKWWEDEHELVESDYEECGFLCRLFFEYIYVENHEEIREKEEDIEETSELMEWVTDFS